MTIGMATMDVSLGSILLFIGWRRQEPYIARLIRERLQVRFRLVSGSFSMREFSLDDKGKLLFRMVD
jgi:hypothetical protein